MTNISRMFREHGEHSRTIPSLIEVSVGAVGDLDALEEDEGDVEALVHEPVPGHQVLFYAASWVYGYRGAWSGSPHNTRWIIVWSGATYCRVVGVPLSINTPA